MGGKVYVSFISMDSNDPLPPGCAKRLAGSGRSARERAAGLLSSHTGSLAHASGRGGIGTNRNGGGAKPNPTATDSHA